jgi:gluconate 5-dehydrogenase
LSGKTALVTGGSRGIGLQMAEGLGEMGRASPSPPASRTSSTRRALIWCSRDPVADGAATLRRSSIPGVVDTVMSHWG